MSEQTASQRYEAAFENVIEMYMDLKSSDGKTWNQVYGNPHTHGNNPLLVKPSDQDFICDVELAFRAVLPTASDIRTLTAVLLNGKPTIASAMFPEEVSPERQKIVKQRVGRELIRRQIFPTNLYFKGKEIIHGA